MAGKQARAAHAESLGEPLSAEESKPLMSDNQEAEHEVVLRPQPEPPRQPQKRRNNLLPLPQRRQPRRILIPPRANNGK